MYCSYPTPILGHVEYLLVVSGFRLIFISKESIFEALNNPLKVEKNKIDKIGSYIHIFCKFNVFESKTVNVFYLNIVFNDYVDKTVSMW